MNHQYSETQKRILYVDDDVDMVEVIKLFLSDYEVSSAYTLPEGLHLARIQYFDLYLLDNWLADESGIELCRLIRQFDSNTPIIFISAAAYEHDMLEAMMAGAQAYLKKPVDLDQLAGIIRSLDRQSTINSLAARIEELAVIGEELRLRRQQIQANRIKARETKKRAAEELLKLKARLAFIEAGGTRANFERMWPELRRQDFTSSGHGV